jgi:hypothetical protein
VLRTFTGLPAGKLSADLAAGDEITVADVAGRLSADFAAGVETSVADVVESFSVDSLGLAVGGVRRTVAAVEGLSISADCSELGCGGISAGWAEAVSDVLAGSGDALKCAIEHFNKYR